MIELINNCKTISIIGMAKNVGKTTTLNYLLKNLYGKKCIGLTSIGRDGEDLDVVTSTKKPKIYIEAGTIVATTKRCLAQSDFTKQILATTSIHTPLGEVVIVRALSDGFVDLAGPSLQSQLRSIIDLFQSYGVDITLIDGALNRKGLADQFISDGTILCTGAAYSSHLQTVVNDTKHVVNLLKLKQCESTYVKRFNHLIHEAPVCVMDDQGHTKQINLKTALHSSHDILKELTQGSRYLLIKGVVTTQLIDKLIDHHHLLGQLTIIIDHPMKCMIDQQSHNRLGNTPIDIQVLKRTNLLCVTYNPVSPSGEVMDDQRFKQELRSVISVPILNVMRDA